MRAKKKLLGILILGIISGIGLSYALNVTQTLDNTVAYIKKMIWTNDGTDLGTKKVIIDGSGGSITMSGALNIQQGALKDDTVVSADIKDGEVKNADIANEAVTNTKLGYDAVTSSKIKNYAIQSWDINTGAIGTNKIANGAVTSDKIKDGAISLEKLSGSLTLNQLTVSGDLDMHNHIITNLTPPINSGDAVNKGRVVNKISSISGGGGNVSRIKLYTGHPDSFSLSGICLPVSKARGLTFTSNDAGDNTLVTIPSYRQREEEHAGTRNDARTMQCNRRQRGDDGDPTSYNRRRAIAGSGFPRQAPGWSNTCSGPIILKCIHYTELHY